MKNRDHFDYGDHYDYKMFSMMTCKCSRRSIREEEAYGSYCDECWSIIKKTRKCFGCDVAVEKERLFVSASHLVPGCFWCFRQRTFPFFIRLPQPGEIKPIY